MILAPGRGLPYNVIMVSHRLKQAQLKVEEFRRKHRIGVVTLLFTDIVGSTRLKQSLGDGDAVSLIKQHQEIIRNILVDFREGEEISTAGDSFFIIFTKPSDA